MKKMTIFAFLGLFFAFVGLQGMDQVRQGWKMRKDDKAVYKASQQIFNQKLQGLKKAFETDPDLAKIPESFEAMVYMIRSGNRRNADEINELKKLVEQLRVQVNQLKKRFDKLALSRKNSKDDSSSNEDLSLPSRETDTQYHNFSSLIRPSSSSSSSQGSQELPAPIPPGDTFGQMPSREQSSSFQRKRDFVDLSPLSKTRQSSEYSVLPAKK